MIYGYARCSTNETKQDINRQKRELINYGVLEKNIFWEYESGAKDNRPQLNLLFETATTGDTIVTTEVSRLARSLQKLCSILEDIKTRQMCLITLDSMSLDCRPGKGTEPTTIAMVQMMGVFSELERSMISERVKSGMRNAIEKGHYPGRPKTTKDNIPERFFIYYTKYHRRELTITEIARYYKCSRTTVYKYIRIIEKGEPLNA